MAANPALASKCVVVGVPGHPRCQTRRNLATKSHNSVAAIANPAVKHEAGFQVSTTTKPSPIRQNLVTKRDQTRIMAVNPATVSFSTGVPVYTLLELRNNSGQFITLDSTNYCHGYGEAPKVIQDQQVGKFQHSAEPAGSIGGIAHLQEKIRWIVAWSNAENDNNKVYTNIMEANVAVDWADVKANLGKSSSQSSVSDVFGFSAEVVIDPTSPSPNVRATLRPDLKSSFAFACLMYLASRWLGYQN